MRILDRYLAREYLAPVFYCVSAFGMLFVVLDLFDRFTKFMTSGTPLREVGWYYVCYLAQVMEYLLPASLMLATLYTLWRLTRHSELMAMRAGGVGLGRIMAPFLAVGVIASAGTAALKERFIPYAAQWVAQFVRNHYREPASVIQRKFPYYNSALHRRWLIEEFDIQRPTVLNGVRIVEETPDTGGSRVTYAKRAEWLDGFWWFFGVETETLTADGVPIVQRLGVPNSELGVEMRRLRERPVDFVNELRDQLFFSAYDIRRYLKAHPGLSEDERARKQADYHAGLAGPWACLIAVLFGVPVGARSGRQNVVFAMLTAALLFVGFYATSQAGLLLGRVGLLPAWLGPWLGNLAFGLGGLVMLGRMR
jgi:lipopolysaccharide export system permease protein